MKVDYKKIDLNRVQGALPWIVLLLALTACGLMEPIQNSPLQTRDSITEQPIGLITEIPSAIPTTVVPLKPTITETLQPEKSTPFPSPEKSATPSITPTSDCQTILFLQGLDAADATDLAISYNGNIWLHHTFWIREYSQSNLLQKIETRDRIVHLVDINISLTGLWILDLDGWPDGWPHRKIVPKVVHLGFDGTFIANYEIPIRLLVDTNGEPVDHGLDNIRWGENGELLLFGPNGWYQFLDMDGNITPHRLVNGWSWGGHLYRVIQAQGDRTSSQPAKVIVAVDNFPIEISTSSDHIYLDRRYPEIFWILPDGSFYVLILEYSDQQTEGVNSIHESLLHFSSSGELLGRAEIPEAQYCRYCGNDIAVGANDKAFVLFKDALNDKVESNIAEVRELCFK